MSQSGFSASNSAAAPSASVGSFRNQQVGGLTAGLSGHTGGPDDQSPQQITPDKATANDSGTVQIANNTLDSVRAAQQRTQNLYMIAAQKKAARAAGGNGGYSGGGNGSPQGQAYTPDGNLSASRNRVLQTASSYLGDRYVLGGTSHQGIDCSGLVMMVYDQLGYGKYLDNHNARIQGQSIPGVRTSIANLRPGDLVAWKDGSHIAIYAGNGQIIEAANERVGTVRRALWASPSQVFGIALRLPGE
jgi:cell wall-associated NlpC family hydrolase